MPVLQPSEYDERYFDGGSQPYAHNAGYTKYQRWFRQDPCTFPDATEHFDEYWKDIAHKAVQKFNLIGKKVLDVGCAKGFLVEDLRNFGVDAYGIDVSQYAIDCASEAIKPYLTVADARTHLASYKSNEWWVVYSIGFMICMSDADLEIVIPEMNRISKYQFHAINPEPNSNFYNVKTMEEWLVYDWDKGTILTPRENNIQEFVKI